MASVTVYLTIERGEEEYRLQVRAHLAGDLLTSYDIEGITPAWGWGEDALQAEAKGRWNDIEEQGQLALDWEN
jgi:hypothetical protein